MINCKIIWVFFFCKYLFYLLDVYIKKKCNMEVKDIFIVMWICLIKMCVKILSICVKKIVINISL